MKKIIPLLLISALATACLPQDVQVPQSPLLPFLERKSGLIAYVGGDGNMYVVDQSGKSPQAITDDADLDESGSGAVRYYQYPTWSLDGNQLAFVAVVGEGAERAQSEMFAWNVDEEQLEKIYSSENEHPFYLYWSPNNNAVSFLSSGASGQSILLQSISVNDGERTILDVGSPYYWSWAPNGSTMIVHAGGAETSPVPEHIAFLQTDSGIIEDGLEAASASFQAPAWSPDGSRILLTRVNDEEENEIILADSAGAYQETLATFDVNAAFAWSPDNQLVAYIEGEQAISAGTLGTLHVMDVNASEDFFQDEDVFAFFWSPNSRKLAYFKPFLVEGSGATGQQLLLQLHVLDVVSGESQELFNFQPSNQFSGVLPYFDQYHQSATIWSPDSNNLVLSFVDAEGNAGIAVVAASGQLEPRLIASGFLAFWSWR